MNSHLEQAIVGDPTTVMLGGTTYTLAFPMEAVILYKRETALLDRARNQGRPKLSRAEISALREERKKLLDEVAALRESKEGGWETLARLETLMEDATAIKVRLDEDSGAGDSLYDIYNWRKISLEGDPERVVLALWVGTHCKDESLPPGRQYVETIPRCTLGMLVDLGNGGDLTTAISSALSAYVISKLQTGQESPNSQPPRLNPETPVVMQAKPERRPRPPEGVAERRHSASSKK